MIKVTSEADKVCVAKANEAGQGHIFDGWDDLTTDEQKTLISQVQSLDFQLMKRLVGQHLHRTDSLPSRVLKPAPLTRLPALDSNREEYELCRTLGEYALRQNEVVLVMAAGGGGLTRFSEPIGMLPVGPVTGKSLFHLHAEKIQALNRRYRTSIRWTIICHPDERDKVAQFFKSNAYFGLQCSDISLVVQDLLPVVDRRGKILLSEPGRMAMSPNGHGGILLGLMQEGRLEAMQNMGVRHIVYFQADNPLVNIADPVFLGYHIKNQSEVSSKAVRRVDPGERVGIFCLVNGTTAVVEHTELGEDDRKARLPDRSLALDAANIGTHLFSVEFLRRMHTERLQLPFHPVRCLTPHVKKGRKIVRPAEPNSVKFVAFVFDAISSSKRTSLLEVQREDEFSPIKHTGGNEASLLTAQRDLSQLYAGWLRAAYPELPEGVGTERGPAVEISPLFAMDAEELKEKLELPLPETTGGILLGGRA